MPVVKFHDSSSAGMMTGIIPGGGEGGTDGGGLVPRSNHLVTHMLPPGGVEVMDGGSATWDG